VKGVGIGLLNPTVMLEIPQDEAFKVGNAYLSSGGNRARLANHWWWDGTNNFTGDGMMIALRGIEGGGDQEIRFHKHTGGVFTRLMTIVSNGNVGIGVTAPTVKLQVAGNIIAVDPTAANHVANKTYADVPPGLDTQLLLASANCPNFLLYGGTDGTQLRMRHMPSGVWSGWITTSQPYCNPVQPGGPNCGNLICDPGETTVSCPGDCP